LVRTRDPRWVGGFTLGVSGRSEGERGRRGEGSGGGGVMDRSVGPHPRREGVEQRGEEEGAKVRTRLELDHGVGRRRSRLVRPNPGGHAFTESDRIGLGRSR